MRILGDGYWVDFLFLGMDTLGLIFLVREAYMHVGILNDSYVLLDL
jgi:hypothetical protein